MPEYRIRKFSVEDRQAVMRIAADTAYFGKPVEAFLEDRRIFQDGFYRYYTDYEPQHAWVACVDEKVIGFIVGCTDTLQRNRRWLATILPGMLGGVITGKYHFDKRSIAYFTGQFNSGLHGDALHTDLKTYPAHLHINLDAEWRGHGLGRRLMQAYLDQLKELKIPGVHLHTFNLDESACILYEKMLFKLLEKRPDHFWSKKLGRIVERRYYGLSL